MSRWHRRLGAISGERNSEGLTVELMLPESGRQWNPADVEIEVIHLSRTYWSGFAARAGGATSISFTPSYVGQIASDLQDHGATAVWSMGSDVHGRHKAQLR